MTKAKRNTTWTFGKVETDHDYYNGHMVTKTVDVFHNDEFVGELKRKTGYKTDRAGAGHDYKEGWRFKPAWILECEENAFYYKVAKVLKTNAPGITKIWDAKKALVAVAEREAMMAQDAAQ